MPSQYQHHIDRCFDTAIGPTGLARASFDKLIASAKPAVESLADRRQAGDMPLLALPGESSDISALQPIAEQLRTDFQDVVVLGTGGSSLGAQTVAARAPGGAEPRLHMPDNLDGEGFAELLASLKPTRTSFLVVSKSGGTAETLAQTLAAMAWLHESRGESAMPAQMIAIVEPGDNPLRRLCDRFMIPIFDHDPNLGGRYSVLSLVGLVPAMLHGLDARAMRAGAIAVLDETLSEPEAPAVAGAAIAVGLARERGVTTNVLMPYASRLERFAAWYRQLWAESLGKDGQGLTPIAALGPVDQHSQLQLWLGGPADKSFTLIEVAAQGRGPALDLGLADNDPALAYLAGHTIGDLVAAEARATAQTLAGRGRPVRLIQLETLDETTLGALCMHFMLETVITAHLLGVDPFDQPAVEEGKVLARQYLAGDEPEAAEEAAPAEAEAEQPEEAEAEETAAAPAEEAAAAQPEEAAAEEAGAEQPEEAAAEETEAGPAEEAAAEEAEAEQPEEAAAEEIEAAPTEEAEAAQPEETEAAPTEEADAAPTEEADAAPTEEAAAEETEADP